MDNPIPKVDLRQSAEVTSEEVIRVFTFIPNIMGIYVSKIEFLLICCRLHQVHISICWILL